MSTTTPDPVRDADGAEEFAALRHRSRTFTAIVGGLVMAWFLVLLLAVGYQRGLMAHTVGGHITVGLLLAWSQVVTTLIVAFVFSRRSRADRPVIARLRARVEEDQAP